LRLGDG